MGKTPPDAAEKTVEEIKKQKVENRRVHMANERTFLAWIRTSIGIMAFGFVVEKFAFFLRQLVFYSARLEMPGRPGVPPTTIKPGYSAVLGLVLVAFGTMTALFSYIRYRTVKKQITEDTYRPSSALYTMLTVFVLVMGILLLAYLIRSF